MKCLSLEQVYLFLEKELPLSQSNKIDEHLDACPKCRKAVEERKVILESARSLPDFEVPADFAKQVMAKIFPEKAPLWGWIAAFASGLVALVLPLFFLFRATSQSVPSLLLSYGRRLANSFDNLLLIIFKVFRLIVVAIKILPQLGKELFKSLSSLTAFISPPVQILIITVVCLLFLSIIYGFGRKLNPENNNEE